MPKKFKFLDKVKVKAFAYSQKDLAFKGSRWSGSRKPATQKNYNPDEIWTVIGRTALNTGVTEYGWGGGEPNNFKITARTTVYIIAKGLQGKKYALPEDMELLEEDKSVRKYCMGNGRCSHEI